jgi:hypothetical protein
VTNASPGRDTFRERRPWRPRTLVLDDGGLLVCRWPGRARRIWWSEVRGVEWLGADRAVVRTARGDVDLGDSFGDVEALVERLERRARQAKAAWRAGGVPPEVLARWLELPDGGELVCAPRRARSLYWLAALLIVAVKEATDLPLPESLVVAIIVLLPLIGVAMPDRFTATVRANVAWLSVRRGRKLFRCRWPELTEVVVGHCTDDRPRGEEVILAAHGERVTFVARGRGRARLLAALRRYEAALHGRFDEAGLAPPPDGALSRISEAEEPDVARGISRTIP